MLPFTVARERCSLSAGQWATDGAVASFAELVSTEKLVLLEPKLLADELPVRALYATPELVDWLDGVLRQDSAPRRSDLTGYEQVEQLVYEFTVGHRLGYQEIKKLMPPSQNVWEARTADVRLFGFFHRKAIFVAVKGETKNRLRFSERYLRFIEETLRFIGSCGLDEPVCMAENDLNALL